MATEGGCRVATSDAFMRTQQHSGLPINNSGNHIFRPRFQLSNEEVSGQRFYAIASIVEAALGGGTVDLETTGGWVLIGLIEWNALATYR